MKAFKETLTEDSRKFKVTLSLKGREGRGPKFKDWITKEASSRFFAAVSQEGDVLVFHFQRLHHAEKFYFACVNTSKIGRIGLKLLTQ